MAFAVLTAVASDEGIGQPPKAWVSRFRERRLATTCLSKSNSGAWGMVAARFKTRCTGTSSGSPEIQVRSSCDIRRSSSSRSGTLVATRKTSIRRGFDSRTLLPHPEIPAENPPGHQVLPDGSSLEPSFAPALSGVNSMTKASGNCDVQIASRSLIPARASMRT